MRAVHRSIVLTLAALAVGCTDAPTTGPGSNARPLTTEAPLSPSAAGSTVNLGTLHTFLKRGEAFGVNEHEQVVGQSPDTDPEGNQAFIWTASGGMKPLELLTPHEGTTNLSSAALDINEDGVAVGWEEDIWRDPGGSGHVRQRGVVWAANGTPRDVGGLGYDPGHTIANAINDGGVVVGESWDEARNVRAFIWTASSGIRAIDVGAASAQSVAEDVNNDGHVVGAVGGRAFIWDATRGVRPLRDPARPSHAYGINNQGQVVGQAFFCDESGHCNIHAFLWTEDDGMEDLGALPGLSSERQSLAFAINDAGQVAGWSDDPTGNRRAFVWTREGGMVDIGTLGGLRGRANDISNAGRIVGLSTDATGSDDPTLWRDVVPPPNRAPALNTSGVSRTLQVGVEFVEEFRANDPDGDLVDVAADRLPEGAVIETVSRTPDVSRFRFRWTPTDAQAGKHTFNVTPTDAKGLAGASSEWALTVDAPPVAVFTFTCDGRACAFDGSGSIDDEGIESYAWTFGDGATATGAKPTHTYAADGEHEVTLTVTDTRDQTGSTTQTVTLGSDNRPPVPVVEGPRTGKVGEAMAFTTSATDPDGDGPLACEIQLGAGSDFVALSNCGAGASHAFTAPGEYLVTLRARDPDGLVGTDTWTVTIGSDEPPPVCSEGTGVAPTLTLIRAYSRTEVGPFPDRIPNVEMLRFGFSDPDCGPWRARIDWGDGTVDEFALDGALGPADNYVAYHDYATPGSYTVKMTLTDSASRSSAEQSISMTAAASIAAP